MTAKLDRSVAAWSGSEPDGEGLVGGGPRLDVLEWLALIQLHRSTGGTVLGPHHPAVLAVSPLLARRAGIRGSARRGAQLRSPEGLARRLSIVRRMARGETSRIPRDASAAWHRFKEDPAGAEELAASILQGEGAGPSGLESETTVNVGALPSRGPAPFVGTALVERIGGPEALYLMILEGAVPPSASQEPALRYVKVGRSQDTRRREDELNLGFPPGLGIRWRLRHEVGLPSSEDAYCLEQVVLRTIATLGMSIGGEFCIGAPVVLWALVEELCGRHSRGSPLPTKEPTANALMGKGSGGRIKNG